MQITKSVNFELGKDKASDKMSMKHRADFGVYVFYGSINTQLAEKTGFNNEDVEKIKNALATLFENDVLAARPVGSIKIHKVYWWEHNSKLGQYSSAKVHRLLEVKRNIDEPKTIDDYSVLVHELDGLKVKTINGM